MIRLTFFMILTVLASKEVGGPLSKITNMRIKNIHGVGFRFVVDTLSETAD